MPEATYIQKEVDFFKSEVRGSELQKCLVEKNLCITSQPQESNIGLYFVSGVALGLLGAMLIKQ